MVVSLVPIPISILLLLKREITKVFSCIKILMERNWQHNFSLWKEVSFHNFNYSITCIITIKGVMCVRGSNKIHLFQLFIHYFYLFSEFSLKNWLQNYNVSSEEVLTKAMTSSLIETLGIGNIIHSLSCERSLNKYSPSIHGWKSGI